MVKGSCSKDVSDKNLMVSVSIPLTQIIVDLDNEVDLLNLPDAEAEQIVRDCYSFLPAPLEILRSGDIVTVRSLKKPPKNVGEAPELFRRAVKFANQGTYTRCIELLERALERDPGHIDARRNLGMALLESGRIDAGRSRLVESSRLDPNDVWTYLLLANSYSKHDRQPEKALRFYQIAYTLNQNDPFVLNSYGAVLIELGRIPRGRELVERALQIDPQYPNAAYCLARLEMKEQKPEETDRIITKLFNAPLSSDPRSIPVYKAARTLLAEANRQIVETNYASIMEAVQQRQQSLEAAGGIPIEIAQDNSLETHAVSKMAWNHNRSKHRVLYRDRGKVITPHLLAHELEHIDLEGSARKLGRNRAFTGTARSREGALKSLDREIYGLRRQGLGESDIMDLVLRTLNGLTSQVFNMPLDMLIEYRVHKQLPKIRPAQFVSLSVSTEEIGQIYSNPQIKKFTLPTIYENSAAINYAFALFIDWLFENRSNFGQEFQSLSGFSPNTVRKGQAIFGFWQEMMGPNGENYQHGDEYLLVDRVAEFLGLSSWYEWRFQGEETDEKTNPFPSC